MGTFAHSSDRRLAVRIGRGDQRALAALFERYFPSVYDFSLRVVEDEQAAATVSEQTFSQAGERLRLGVRPRRVRAWLLALAREASLGAAGTGSRTQPDSRDAASPAGLVAGYGPRDRSLFDLNLRRGLTEDEIAETLSLEPAHVRTRLRRLREAFEQDSAAAYLVHQGRSECADADALLARAQAQRDPLPRRELWKHARSCRSCQSVLRREGATVEALAAEPPAAQPAGLAGAIWDRLADQSPERGRRAGRLLFPAVAGAAGGMAVVAVLVPGQLEEVRPVRSAVAGVEAHIQGRASVAAASPHVRSQAGGTAAGAFLPPDQGRTFAWAPVAGASSYAFALYRGADAVYEARSGAARLVLPPRWHHRGALETLAPGRYRWVVWPVDESGNRADEAIVNSALVVPG